MPTPARQSNSGFRSRPGYRLARVSVIGTIYIPFGSGIFGRWQYCYDLGWMVGSLRMLGFGSLGPGFAAWKEFCFFSRSRFLEGAAVALPSGLMPSTSRVLRYWIMRRHFAVLLAF
ncbi:hypothetical protein F5X68DRAFT_19237 [Plectosphaerella plurivora]|uniref:Uncharacterized protein n=1 Tax=Plectosphaerella plurivora TaxID=936078 RepID=A0A9P8V9E0_9PEZI|nr:hypothetical protein F5X68DRAFT_19237 [Plectosphaerella plurivora]